MPDPNLIAHYNGPGAYRVMGVDKESRLDTELVVSASSRDNARVKAELQGMIVTAIQPAPSTIAALTKAQKKKDAKGNWIRLGVAGGFIVCVAICCSGVLSSSEPNRRSSGPSRSTVASSPAPSVPNGFSAWDGSHTGLVKLIKADMNDPDSFQHVETRVVDKGDHLLVGMTFRGKNAFGGVVTQIAYAKVSPNGSVLELVGVTSK